MEAAVSAVTAGGTTSKPSQQQQQLPLGDVNEYDDDEDEEQEGKTSNKEVGDFRWFDFHRLVESFYEVFLFKNGYL